jgi:hypothetical protein
MAKKMKHLQNMLFGGKFILTPNGLACVKITVTDNYKFAETIMECS